MKRTKLFNAMAVGVLAIASGAVQAITLPNFWFTEVAGFQSNAPAPGTATPAFVGYGGALDPGPAPTTVCPILGDIRVGCMPAGSTLDAQMEWRVPPISGTATSTLTLDNPAGIKAPLPVNPVTPYDYGVGIGFNPVITTLQHANNVISAPFNWSGQDIWGRFQVWEGDTAATSVLRLDDTSKITISFTETLNRLNATTNTCTGGNPFPVGTASPCPDYFTFTSSGLVDLEFQAKNGAWWTVRFDLDIANCVGCAFDPTTGRVFTRETQVSTLGITAAIRCEPFKGRPPFTSTSEPQDPADCEIKRVPEPSVLTLLGLGLLGLGFAGWRRQKGARV